MAQRQPKPAPIEVAAERPELTYLENLMSAIPDGRATVISYLRQLAFENDIYRDFIREFDKNKRVDLGVLCEQFKILPVDLLADVNRAAYPVLEEASKLAQGIARGIVSKRLPKVVERGMIEGGKSDGVADRHFTLQHEGFHVAPKGMQINMQQVNQTAAGLDDFSSEVKEMASILGEPLELTEGTTDYIDVETEMADDLREDEKVGV